ncbi:PTS ascorbate transporter subunit IIC [Fundicoccus culcitae]|uniref:Ascorbate-specific PTS system EIIC component n=1 Tax=Fundicoccus culcitae TaxID=2969821 RepID=A0ABY5P3X5_9LACT|nr:PTS ascorbate transporter subunit IIC [Fundicoccus culcitae]UUX33444.1 PTS ascorbate transporter subunit IIC [Fundicoccus culcitae]
MLDVLINDILGTPAILVGLFVLVGSVLLGSPIAEIITATFNTIIGFIMLNLGAGIAADTLDNFSAMFVEAFGIQAAVMSTDAMGALLLEEYPSATVIFVLAMVFNLLIARFTRFKYIYLASHLVMYLSAMFAMIFEGLPYWPATIMAAILIAIYMAVSPALIQPFTRKITGTDEFAVANAGSSSFLIGALMGKLVGDPSQSTEDMNVPQSLSFLKTPAISISLTMSILFIVLAVLSGQTFVESQLSGGTNYIFFAFMQAIYFAAGIEILITGVNMALKEIVPAFKGIANRLIPNAVPSLDSPVMLPYGSNSLILGFLVSLAVGMLGIFVLPMVGLPIIIPGMQQYFFLGGITAMYGNATGGYKGAIAGAFVVGLVMVFMPAIYMVYVGDPTDNIVFGDSDFLFIGVFFKWFVGLFR